MQKTVLDRGGPGDKWVGIKNTEDSTSTERLPSLANLVTRQLDALGISTEKVTELVNTVEQEVTRLVHSEQLDQTTYDALVSTLIAYIEQGTALASVEALASLTRRTRARIQAGLKRNRNAGVRALMALVTTAARQGKVKIGPLDKEIVKQALERQLDTFSDYLINRLVDQEQGQASTEPINLQVRRKAATLREYGYVFTNDGLFSICHGPDGEEKLMLIERLQADVIKTRHVFTVPESLHDMPKEQGVVLVTRFAPLVHLASPYDERVSQTLEIYRSDMLARQPKFLEQMHVVIPPHKKRQADFIRALDALGSLAPIENRYNATGLVCPRDNALVFLHPTGGALTSGGLDEQHQVQFPMQVASRLTSIKYGWQRPSRQDERIEDYRTLLKILNIAPGSTGYGDVLLGVHGFAPMSQLCDTGGLWAIIHGLTGSLKSATSRLPLQGYALFHGRQETSTINLREGASTSYAIEQVLYYLAGMFAHLDDGLKGNNVPPKDVEKFYKTLSTIGGHAVTKQGGKRGVWGQGEGGFGIEPYARGSGVYTVETLPASEGHASDIARYLVASLDGAACVNTALLTELQTESAAASMNRATCSYILWLLPRMYDVLAGITEREEIYREQGVHTRTPTSYAKAETAIAALLQYGVAIGAHTEEDAARLLAESRARLVQVALRQKALMGVDEQTATANDTVTVFYSLLREAMRAPAHKLYVTDTAYRDIEIKKWNEELKREEVIEVMKRPQPPLFLANEQIEHGLDPLPDNHGWKPNEHLHIYEPLGVEAGVLKWDGVKPALHIYVKDFKEVVYPALVKLADSQQIPLPGLNDMLSKLKEKGKLTNTNPTNLHGRNSRTDRCYVLDMTPAPSSTEQNSTEQEELYHYVTHIYDDGTEEGLL